jgi:hypothetical protein
MMVGLRGILQVVAILCFLVAAFGFAIEGIGLTQIGLALFVASFMVPEREMNLPG